MDTIKKSLICKKVKAYQVDESIAKTHRPKVGDVAIFEVVAIGKHNAIQGTGGSNKYIFPGDLVMMAFGNRYASAQFEGYIPDNWQEEYHILGKGGCAGVVASMHMRMSLRGPTRLKLKGYATDSEGRVLNTRYMDSEKVSFATLRPSANYRVILSLGTSMDSGKTTTAAFLARGLMKAGKHVAYIKTTGTVFSKDRAYVRDCGAHFVKDFSQLGYPSTYMLEEDELLDIFATLLTEAAQIQPDYVIVEIADGLLQRETSMLLQNPHFLSFIDHLMLSSGDSMGAISGIEELHRLGLQPSGLCGAFQAAPLLVKEVRSRVDLPIFSLSVLSDPSIVQKLRPAHLTHMNGVMNAAAKELTADCNSQ